MGKYNSYMKEQPPRNGQKVHPIWRGIGFALMIIVPLLSYVASLLILEANNTHHWFPIPSELIAHGSDPLLYTKIFITVVLCIIAFGVFNLITAIANSMFGPPRYGPMDAPPVRKARRKASKR